MFERYTSSKLQRTISQVLKYLPSLPSQYWVLRLMTAGLISMAPPALANNAPVLDFSENPILTAINENDFTSSGASVYDLIDSVSGVPLDLITDVDSGALEGIAVIAIDNTNGSWEFSIDNGSIWTIFGTVDETTARLLTSEVTTLIRFVPDIYFNGNVNLSFRAWDQTSGSNGGIADVSTNGGTTAFSAETETASITINPVNDAPVFTSTAGTSVYEGALYTYNITIYEIDIGDSLVISAPIKPAWLTLTDNGNGTGTLSGTPTNVGSDNVTLRVNDGTVDVDQSFTITVINVNDAPVLDFSANPVLTAINEDEFTSSGTSVYDLIDSVSGVPLDLITDVDSSAVEGIAVITVDNTNGSWEFSIDNGSTWIIFGSVDETTARLLTSEATTLIRFIPNMNFNGSVNLSFRAWDRTSGSNGGTVDVSTNGGITAFSTETETASITINPVNDTPTFTSTAGTTINEDALYTYNITTNDIDIGDSFVISAPTKPAWLTLTDNGNGTGTLSGTPTNNEVGSHNVTLRVNDGTVDVDQSFTITVDNVNDAPVLDFSANPVLTAINEDDFTNSGTSVSDLIDSVSGVPLDLITDVDSSALEGIAAFTVDNTNGSWEFSIDNGSTWIAFGTVGETTARLLTSEITTLIRFIPNMNFNGSVNLSFRAWDRTNGSNGGTADVSTNGGITAFSAETETASITINPVNDAPTFASTAGTSVNEDALYTYNITTNDIDIGDSFVISAPTKPAWLTLTDNGNGTGTLSGTPTNNEVGSHNITLRVNDGTVDVDQSFTITVSNVNDAPVLDFSANPILTAINEDDFTSSGISVYDLIDSVSGVPLDLITDVDSSALEGIAVITVDNTLGSWEFSIDTGSTWTAFGTVDETTARLLTSEITTLIRFIPNMNFNGNVNMSFRAWDRTNGSNGGTADVSTNGGITAFSAETETASITINPVNDAPTFASTAGILVNKDVLYTYNITINEIDIGDSSVISAPIKPAWLTLTDNGDGTGTLSGTPTHIEVGSHNVTLRVNDGTVDVDQSFTITVNNVNDAPTFTSTAGTSVNEDALYTYNITTTDINIGDSFVISAPTKPAWLNLTDNGDGTGTLSGTPTNSEVGTHNVTLRVNDGTVDVDQSFTITVNNVNDAPTFTSTAGTSVNEDALYSYSITTNDVDGNSLTITAPTKPAWLTLTDNGNGTATLSGTPTNSEVGSHNVILRVNDGTVDVDQSFTLSVNNTNDAPTFTSTAGTSVNEDALYTYNITTNDIDIGDSFVITVPTKPAWLNLTDNGDGTGTLSGTPTNSEVGTHNVTLRVNDGTVDVDQSFTLTVNNVNDAPVLDFSENPVLTAINEDDFTSSGTSVSDLIDSVSGVPLNLITDVDNSALEGIAVITVDNTNGSWEFSIDTGSSWAAFGTVDETTARLLTSDSANLIRFIPNANFNGNVNITFRAWDQTSGSNAGTADVSTNGGITAFSVNTETASITINPVNDAPTFSSTAGTTLNEDVLYTYNISINDIDIGDSFAISAPTKPAWLNLTDNGDGTGTLSGTPTNSEVGTHNVTLRVNDGTVDVDQSFTITVNNVNDAPVLDFSENPVLTAINEDDFTSSGTSVYGLIDSVSGVPLNLITDVDSSALEGIAVITVDNTNGSWEFSIDTGSSWSAFGTVDETTARLLTSDSANLIRFIPNANFNGNVNITFRAWDQTSGSNGGTADVSTNGALTAFSAETETASITINPVNDAPTFSSTAGTTLNEDALYTYNITINDIDIGDSFAISAPTKPAWLNLTDNGDGTGTLSGTPTNSEVGTHNVTLRVNDGTVDVDQSFTLTVNNVNDAPVLDFSENPVLTAINEDDFTSSGTSVSDLIDSVSGVPLDLITDDDSGAIEGIAVITVDNTSGSWEFSIDTGSSWIAFGTVDETTARLLTSDSANLIRFIPNADFNGNVNITFRAWDQTSGSNGGTANVSTNGGLTAFSVATETASLTINPVNDAAPTFTSTAGTSVNEDALYTYNITTNDIDIGESFVITAPTKPAWLNLTDNGDGTGTLSGTPTNSEVGTHNITLRVNDGTVDVDQSFTIMVNNVNDAPTFTSTAGTSVNEDALYSYSITTNDVDGNSLTITAPTKPAWLNLTDNGNGTGTLSGTPTNSEVGTHNVTLRVNDGTVDVDQSFTITVNNTNDAPTFTSTAVTSVNEDAPYSYSITTLDVDDSLTITAPTKPAWLTFTHNGDTTATLTGTPTNNEVGTHNVTLRVNDGTVDVVQSFTITVNNVTDAPTFTSTAGTSVNEDALYTYNITINDIDIGDSFVISAPTKPAWLDLTDNGDGTGTLSGTPTNSEVGTHNVTLRVNDGTVDVDQSFTITVNNVNDAPVLDFSDNPVLTAINEDDFTSSGASVYDLIDSVSGVPLDLITDVDSSALEGIAVITVDNTNGSWEFSIDTGSTWSAFETVDETTARLLTSDSANLIRFIPNADFNGNVNITFRAWDQTSGSNGETADVSTNGGLTAFSAETETASLTINQVNDAFTFTSTAGTSVNEDALYTYNLTINDIDISDSFVITVPTKPAWLNLTDNGNGSGTLSGTPTNSEVGTHNVTLRVNDGTVDIDQSFTITVNNVNDAPTFTSTAVTSVNEDAFYTYNITTNDIDIGKSLVITAPTKPAWLNLTDNGNGTGTLSGTPTHSEVGTHNVTLRVNDGTVDIDQSFTITVNNVNDAPTFTSTAVTSVNEDALYTYNITTNDIDLGNSLVITAPTKPAWLNLTDNGDGTGTLSGIPTNSEVGTHNVTLRVNDGTVDVVQSFTITVNNVTDAPTFTSTAGISVNEDALYTYNITINDIDRGDSFVISAPTKPAWLYLTDNGNGTGILSGTPTNTEVGTHNVTLRVNDGTVDVDLIFTITVNNTNDAPTFTSTAGTSVNEDALYAYNITINDIDIGDSFVISAPTKPAWLNLTDNGDGTGTLSGTPTNSEVGTHNVTLRVNDGTVDVVQSFTITVNNTNDAPTFTSTAGTSVNEDALYTYNITINDIDIGDSFVISAPTKPAWLNLTDNGNGTGTLSGTPVNVTAGEHQVTLRVNDGTVDVDQSFTITVVNVNNEAPVFENSPITSVDKNTLYRYDITISDADIDDQLTLTAPLKPAWLTLTDNGDGTALLSGTPTEAEIGFHEVALRVNDGTVDVEQSFIVTVNDVVLLSGITLKCAGGSIKEAYLETVEAQSVGPGGYEFPAGLVGFEVENLANSSVVFSVFYNNINELENFIYLKYGPTTPGDSNSADWYTFSNVSIELDTLDGQSVVKASLTLSDGVLGDDTGVDGRIIDVGGIAIELDSPPIVSNPVASGAVETGCSGSGSISGSCNAGEQTFTGGVDVNPPPIVSNPVASGPVETGCSGSASVSGSCNAGGQTFTDEVEVNENASVAQATFEGDVDNKGMISDSTIRPGATLTGGELTGNITNEGTIADVNFVGAELSGGTLSGIVVNNSKEGGVIKDVQLAGDMVLKGGRLGGQISGTLDNPALITAAEILPGSVLSNVRISPTVQLPEDVELGEGVILPSEPPTPADFGLEPEDIAKMDASTLGDLEPAALGSFAASYVTQIPPDAFVALEAAQIAEVPKEALEGLTTEQFEKMQVETLGGLTSENMGGLPTEVLTEFTPEHLDALDVKEFKAMPSEDVSKLFVNLDLENITPKDAERLVPENWQLDLETGALTAPVGTKLAFQTVPSSSTTPGSSTMVRLPEVANLNTGLGIGGKGTPLMEDTKRSLEEEDLEDFVLSQDEKGILQVEGTGDSAGILYTFIPDTDNAIVVDTDKIPIGLSVGAGGFYTITTPEGIQYRVIPAPKDPVALSQSLGGGEVVVGKRGDVMVELPTQTRAGARPRKVAIMDPFVEPALKDDKCQEVQPGVAVCEEPGQPSSIKAVYPDGSAQTVRATVYDPDTFIEKSLEFDGVESPIFNADGTFSLLYQGQGFRLIPNFDVTTTADDGSIEPSIVVNDNGTLSYTIAIDDRTREEHREGLIFELAIVPE